MATRFDDWEGDFLAHHGIKGQKWGIRRYQNPDGTLTEAGKRREQKQFYKDVKRNIKLARKANKVELKRIADVSYDDKYPSARVKRKVLESYDNYRKLEKPIQEMVDLGKKWDRVGEKANSYQNYVRNRYRNGELSKRVQQKQARLNKDSKAAMDAYISKGKSITNELLGKYGKKKLVVDRVFGIGMKRKASSIVEDALYRSASDIIEYDRKKENRKR